MTATETLVATVSTATKKRLVAESARRRVAMTVLVREALDAYLMPAPAQKPTPPPASTRLPSARALPEPGTRSLFAACEEAAE